MRRRLAIAVLLATAPAAVPAPAAGEPLPATVRLAKCSLSEHEAAFYARMRNVPGGDRMWMRFTLLERTGPEGFEPLRAPGLGRWQKSRTGVGAFGYRQAVRNLPDNAAYRMRVDFRWYSPAGELLEEVRRRSPSCRQFDALPNLRALLVEAQATTRPGVLRYVLEISNDGRAAARAVPLRLSVDGDVVDTVTLATLLPGESRLFAIGGPECTRTVEAAADPDGEIIESFEEDNADEVACADLRPG
jgi:hypothetical protein